MSELMFLSWLSYSMYFLSLSLPGAFSDNGEDGIRNKRLGLGGEPVSSGSSRVVVWGPILAFTTGWTLLRGRKGITV